MKSAAVAPINEYKLQLLRQMVGRARTVKDFTRQAVQHQLSPIHTQERLNELVSDGYAWMRGDQYRTTPKGTQFVESQASKLVYAEVPVRNATTKEPLEMRQVWTGAMRPGALDFMNCRSRGVGC